MRAIHRICSLLILSTGYLSVLAGCHEALGQTSAARHFYLDDLIYEHRYTPAKNSLIFQQMKRRDRKILVDVKGCGSIRHIWSTWARSFDQNSGTEPNKVLLRVFVNGEVSPSIVGTIDELFEAAQKTAEHYVPEAAFNYEGAFNLYLPIYFKNGCRIEVEALDDLDECYAQIDYRLTQKPESTAHLFSRRTSSGLALEYTGKGAPQFFRQQQIVHEPPLQSKLIELPAMGTNELLINGPAVLQELVFEGPQLGNLELSISWDDEVTPSVHAPLNYLFGGFDTLALQSRMGAFACYFPMPFHKVARLKLENPTITSQSVMIRYALNRRKRLPAALYYFHALFKSEQTVGYRDFAVLATHGEGHFVGINLFDSGHNHGGGDTALIDAETSTPRVLHGVAGEDYFSFAWHKTGRMHLMAGAPVHERRYRFHLENPYPFQSSLIFSFGIFAGLRPKAVVFWYQKAGLQRNEDWLAPNAAWRVLGPFDKNREIPEDSSDRGLETVVSFAKPEPLNVRWEEALMVSGFLDLTHHFRHYLFSTKGTGFVAGECRMKALTYIYSPVARQVETLVGHDDAVWLSVNDEKPEVLPSGDGFHSSFVNLNLRAGWNKLSLVLDNRENITWRWLGFSLGMRGNADQLRGIKFSPKED